MVVLINHHGPGKLHPKVPHQLWLLTYFSLTSLSQECEDWQTDILSYDLVQLDMKVRTLQQYQKLVIGYVTLHLLRHSASVTSLCICSVTRHLLRHSASVTSLGICYVTLHLLRHSASVTSLGICYVTRHLLRHSASVTSLGICYVTRHLLRHSTSVS